MHAMGKLNEGGGEGATPSPIDISKQSLIWKLIRESDKNYIEIWPKEQRVVMRLNKYPLTG